MNKLSKETNRLLSKVMWMFWTDVFQFNERNERIKKRNKNVINKRNAIHLILLQNYYRKNLTFSNSDFLSSKKFNFEFKIFEF